MHADDDTGDGRAVAPVAEYGARPVARATASTVVPKRQPWGGPDWPQRSGYEIRAAAERHTALAICDALRAEIDTPAGAGVSTGDDGGDGA